MENMVTPQKIKLGYHMIQHSHFWLFIQRTAIDTVKWYQDSHVKYNTLPNSQDVEIT